MGLEYRLELAGEPAVVHISDANDDSLETASAQTVYKVRRADLPLSCPMPDQQLWNSHPRVYLPIEATGKAMCPYCGARYELQD